MPQAKMREKPALPLASARFVDGKAMLIAGLRRVYGPREMNKIATLWQSFAPHIGKIAGQVGRTTYGVCWQASDGESIEYLSGVEVRGFAGVPSSFTVVSLAPARYAVFPHRDHVLKLSQTIDAVFSEWLPESAYGAGGDPETPAFIERYGEEFDPRTGMGGMEVWVPLKS